MPTQSKDEKQSTHKQAAFNYKIYFTLINGVINQITDNCSFKKKILERKKALIIFCYILFLPSSFKNNFTIYSKINYKKYSHICRHTL